MINRRDSLRPLTSGFIHEDEETRKRERTHLDLTGHFISAISETRSELWTPGRGRLAWTSEYDVSVMELTDPQFLEQLGRARYREFLDDRDVHKGPLPADFMLYGYPAEDVKATESDLTGAPIMLNTKLFAGDPQGLKRARGEYDLFLAWAGDEDKDLTGISGTPVWAVTNGPAGPGAVWTPDQSIKLCAVETSVRRGEWIRGSGWTVVERIVAHLEKG